MRRYERFWYSLIWLERRHFVSHNHSYAIVDLHLACLQHNGAHSWPAWIPYRIFSLLFRIFLFGNLANLSRAFGESFFLFSAK